MAKKLVKKSITDKKKAEKISLEDQLKEVKQFFKVLVNAIVFVLILNGLAIASFVVPTGSMENEVEPGDFLFVNRFIYGPTTPQIIPLINIELPFIKFPGFWEPEIGDVIVFEYPGPYNQLRNDQFIYYLKRCWGTPGDTLQIINKKIYINGQAQEDVDEVQFLWDTLRSIKQGNYNTNLSEKERSKLLRDFMYQDSVTYFPPTKNWHLDNYGPIYIPKEGDVLTIEYTNEFIDNWQWFIKREGHDFAVDRINREILIDGEPSTEYVVERDYCFAMGDNRHNSLDSRAWGFVPKENIVGTPMMVYWNIDPSEAETGVLSNIFNILASSDLSRVGNIIN